MVRARKVDIGHRSVGSHSRLLVVGCWQLAVAVISPLSIVQQQ